MWKNLIKPLIVKASKSTLIKNELSFPKRYSHTEKAQKYVPRRAVMYVPGDDLKKLLKIQFTGVDCAVLECEDGVALNKKDVARQNIRQALDKQSIDFGRSECAVRVNSVSSGLIHEDLSIILKAVTLPNTLFIPKVDSVEDVEIICNHLDKILNERSDVKKKLNLIIYMESAMALLNLQSICRRLLELSVNSPYCLDGIVFGSDDFLADIGAARTEDAIEMLTARQLVLATAKAFHLQAIDMVYIDFKNLEGLRKQCVQGAKMGYTGKQVIHPAQVAIVQESFLPPLEKVEWARELITLFEQHQKEGKGAFTFRGAMIDRPLLLQAKNIIQLADSV